MAGRPGFFGGPRREGGDFGSDGYGTDGVAYPRGADPAWPDDGGGLPPGFDPVWGTLGAPPAPTIDSWLTESADPEGFVVEVEIFGSGFQISGKLATGHFDRLSDWLNMQGGFIQVREACHVHLGHETIKSTDNRGTLWIRVDQIVLVAERQISNQSRPGAPVVQKQKRRVSIVTPGYSLRGSLHVHAHGSMKQFLETPDPHFLPITDVNVHWLDDANLGAHYPFAVINREQLITLLDETTISGNDTTADTEDVGRGVGAA